MSYSPDTVRLYGLWDWTNVNPQELQNVCSLYCHKYDRMHYILAGYLYTLLKKYITGVTVWLNQSLLEDQPPYLGSNYEWDFFYSSGMYDFRLSLFPCRTFDAQLLDFTLHAVLMWSLAWGWCSADGVGSRWMNWSCQTVPSFSCHCSMGQSCAFVSLSFSQQFPSLTCICACPWHYHQQICARGPEERLKYCWGFWACALLQTASKG